MLSDNKQIASIINFPQQIPISENKVEDIKLNSFISTDSTNDLNINVKKQKYIFENNKISYSISLILLEEKIKIKVCPMIEEKDVYYYEKDYSQEELNKINKVFKLCNNIDESYDYINDLFKEKQNQIKVYENNEIFKIEKKMQILPLYLEIPKKLKNNNNIVIKDTSIVSHVNNKNNDIQKKLEKIEDENSNLIETVKKKYIENEERFNKLSQNINIIDNFVNFLNEKKSEEKKQICSLLNKKRNSKSNLSDISFNSNSNDNELKRNKSNLEKENFLRIFSDNNSVNSENSNEKFFMKILKQKNLEKENIEKNQNNKNFNENNNLYNKKEEENESYLFGDQDSSEEIKDDIDFFSNPSPSETIRGPKNNNDSNNYLYKNDNNKSLNSLLYKDNIYVNNESLFNKNKIDNKFNQNNNKKSYEEIIKNDNKSDWSVNKSYNMIGSVYERDSFFRRRNNNKLYKIFYKNCVECCNKDLYLGFNDKNQYLNNIFSLDSKIISNFSEFDFIINYLKIKLKKEIINSIRIYRATEDGDRAEDFHRLCDGNTNIIVLIKTKDGKKIGGYTSIGFNNLNQSILDDTAFIFSIDKREIYPNIKGKNAIESYNNIGPTFSGDSIKIYDNFLKKGGITSKTGLNYQTYEDFQINDGKKFFNIEEIEVLEFLEMKIDDI